MIKFTKEENEFLIKKLQLYVREEMNQEIGQFDTGFLLEFIAEEIGVYFYNRGLHDAQAILHSRLDDLSDAIYEIEKPTEFDSR